MVLGTILPLNVSVSLSSPICMFRHPGGSGDSFAGASVLFCFCLRGRGRAQEPVLAKLRILTSACLAVIVLISVSEVFL